MVPFFIHLAIALALHGAACSSVQDPADRPDSTNRPNRPPGEPTFHHLSSARVHGGGPGHTEVTKHHPATQRLFTVNAAERRVDILSIADPRDPQPVGSLNLRAHFKKAAPNSVALRGDLVCVAVEARPRSRPGAIQFWNARTLEFITQLEVGPVPDMVEFDADGRFCIVANEAEADPTLHLDPDGSVTVVRMPTLDPATLEFDLPRDVRTATFTRFNAERKALSAAGLRISPRAATLAQDMEPEYVAVNPLADIAYVSCQENNAIAVVDLETATVTELRPLGLKQFGRPAATTPLQPRIAPALGGRVVSVPPLRLDPSDQDGGIRLGTWDVSALYMPDTLTAFQLGERVLIATANEGDPRLEPPIDFARVDKLRLDPTTFPDARRLQRDKRLGRLQVSTLDGDLDGDGDLDRLVAFGARSFSLWDAATGEQVFDSGDWLARYLAKFAPQRFNANGSVDQRDRRSDKAGCEPEALCVAEVNGSTWLLLGLERPNDLLAFDIGNPTAPRFLGTMFRDADVSPESVILIAAAQSPTGKPLIVVSYEVSGTLGIWEVRSASD